MQLVNMNRQHYKITGNDYEDINGNLKYELSDTIIHIKNNDKILEKLYKLLE